MVTQLHFTMARLIHRLYNEQAFRRERVIRDRSNPLEIYSDEELIERFRFCRRDLLELIEELSPTWSMCRITMQRSHPLCSYLLHFGFMQTVHFKT